MQPDLKWRVGVTSSHGHQHWGHIRGFSLERKLLEEVLLRSIPENERVFLSKDTKTSAFLVLSFSCP